MTDKTQYLLKLVKGNVKAYITNPKTKAVMVTGSVAEGLCDEYSDCTVAACKQSNLWLTLRLLATFSDGERLRALR